MAPAAPISTGTGTIREPQTRSCNTNSDIEGPFAPPSDPALLRLLLRH
jgi:hypothetical protein